MEKEVQVSAPVSRATRDMLERYVQRTGKNKGRVIEDALRSYLEAMNDLPPDVSIPSRLVLTPKSGAKLLSLLESPPKPSAALRKLMRNARQKTR